MRRMDLHAFHGSRHCWHDCHAVERHVECVSVRILKVTAAHRSSCRPRDTRRRLKTFFGTFLRPRNASRARDSLSLSLSALTALHLLVFSSKSTSNLFEGGRQKSSRENGRKRGNCAKDVQKIQNIQKVRLWYSNGTNFYSIILYTSIEKIFEVQKQHVRDTWKIFTEWKKILSTGERYSSIFVWQAVTLWELNNVYHVESTDLASSFSR